MLGLVQLGADDRLLVVVVGATLARGDEPCPHLDAGITEAQDVGELLVRKFGDGLRLDRRWDDMVSGIQRTIYRIGQAELRE